MITASLIDLYFLRKVYEYDYPWITYNPNRGPNEYY